MCESFSTVGEISSKHYIIHLFKPCKGQNLVQFAYVHWLYDTVGKNCSYLLGPQKYFPSSKTQKKDRDIFSNELLTRRLATVQQVHLPPKKFK